MRCCCVSVPRLAEVDSLAACCRDLHALVKCFEDKKARKYRRFGFHHYPQEVLAYAAVLGLVGREDDGLRELDAAFDRLKASPAEQERFRQALTALWKKGMGAGRPSPEKGRHAVAHLVARVCRLPLHTPSRRRPFRTRKRRPRIGRPKRRAGTDGGKQTRGGAGGGTGHARALRPPSVLAGRGRDRDRDQQGAAPRGGSHPVPTTSRAGRRAGGSARRGCT